jgi:hypothetical protein
MHFCNDTFNTKKRMIVITFNFQIFTFQTNETFVYIPTGIF